MAGHTVGYIRVSTLDQNTIQQLDGEILDLTFTNTASGKHQNRPELEDLIKFVRDGDTVLGHSMDRLARDLGISRETVYQYLRASQQPGKSIARRGTPSGKS